MKTTNVVVEWNTAIQHLPARRLHDIVSIVFGTRPSSGGRMIITGWTRKRQTTGKGRWILFIRCAIEDTVRVIQRDSWYAPPWEKDKT
jgi:hypothetical protein